MAKKGKSVQSEGLDDYIRVMAQLANEKQTAGMCKSIIYNGAKVVTDTVRQEITTSGSGNNPRHGMTNADKLDLLQGLGISKISDDLANMDAKVGFNGYSTRRSFYDPHNYYKYGELPIPLVARTCIKGTSWHKKDDFIGRAVRKSKEKAVQAMDEQANIIIKRIFKGGGS